MNSKNTMILLGVASGLILAGGAGGSYMQYQRLQEVNKKSAALRTQVAEQGDIDERLTAMQQQVQVSQQKLDHLEQGVPARAYIPTMMKELEIIGKENGIDVLGVRPMPPKFGSAPPPSNTEDGEKAERPRPKPYDEQFIEVKGTGEYMKVLAFLGALERFPKIVAVSQVTLQPREMTQEEAATKTGVELEITVELRAFLFPNEMPKKETKVAQGEGNGQS